MGDSEKVMRESREDRANMASNFSPKPRSFLARWHWWVGYASLGWSILYCLLGFYWALGGGGFPFGENDTRGDMMGSFLSNLSADVGGTAIAIICLVGIVVALAMVQSWGRWIPKVLILSFSMLMCVTLILVVPDVRIVQNFAYMFALHFDLIDWLVVNQVFCIIGGFIWGAAAVAYHLRTREACGNCGRIDASKGTSSISMTQWGKWFTYISIILALPYGIVRWAWAAGIPLGVSGEVWVANTSLEGKMVEFILGGLHIGGAILSLGLIQSWGETFPRWCLFLAKKRIPIWFVVAPATMASAIITVAGLKTSIQIISGIVNGTFSITIDNWGEFGPTLFWLPWGISLGAATFAYYMRRRGQCKYCGRH
ncbi:hypothetical protein JOC86_004704 [Bacillus pakistanensis]|uniref:Uncharacterized protein n=1 Tax=Rossellomorea pakistanensis TaxID=992288 RepID=A0ABS2NJV0_9BACI|nr:hypothetical protein [Bacillus pakistanensis]MBM7588129.1 hypothetical protein [Bacillus pakistanensis]